jgi:hypothetical protein
MATKKNDSKHIELKQNTSINDVNLINIIKLGWRHSSRKL